MIGSLRNLEKIRTSRRPDIELRTGGAGGDGQKHVLVCSGTGCVSSAGNGVLDQLKKEVESAGLGKNVRVFKTGCFGFCRVGPIVMVHPGETFYCPVEKKDVPELVEEHLKNGRVLERLLHRDEVAGGPVRRRSDIRFFQA